MQGESSTALQEPPGSAVREGYIASQQRSKADPNPVAWGGGKGEEWTKMENSGKGRPSEGHEEEKAVKSRIETV